MGNAYLEAKIDYIRVSFKTHDLDKILQQVLHIRKEYMLHSEVARMSYVGMYQIDNIHCYYAAPSDDAKGILIQMSGQGCRQFEGFLEARGKTWFDFLKDCTKHGGQFPRLDIAIDDTKTYLDINKLIVKCIKNEVVTRFSKFNTNSGGRFGKIDAEPTGSTLYLGSKKSDIFFRFYEKNYEQAEKLKIDVAEFGAWNRYELAMMDDRAYEAVKLLIRTEDMSLVGRGILNNYVCFVNWKKDANKYRAQTYRDWERFLNGATKMPLTVEAEREFYQKSMNWLRNSASNTMKMVQEIDKIRGTNDLDEMIAEAELKPRQEHMMDIFLNDIKDMVI
ncbi:replication initiation factor domain-containing protein [Listeria booriae]|uniref:Replication initiation factor domain-containing protein n=1 Tax=Listeria booriae TaxID=1552123 RepID=A0A842GB45_9LIST|nr:replication initiation factor domain-containing protein [Listeria booriae]MBC2294743.1 replication initiation factor domain-containing protein [Listeria booriae]